MDDFFSVDGLGGSDHSADHGTHSGNNLQDDFYDLIGITPGNYDWSAVSDEEGDLGAHHDHQASDYAARSHLPVLETKAQKRIDRISTDDFEEGAERQACMIIMSYMSMLFPDTLPGRGRKSTKPKDIEEVKQAINFLFGRTQSGDMNFDLCCQVLQARRDVLRMRIHYEFWLRQIVFSKEFPFMIDPLPFRIENEALEIALEPGLIIASICWKHPGIEYSNLINLAAERGISLHAATDALDRLDAAHLVSSFVDYWYLTGRNPFRMHTEAIASRKPNAAWRKGWASLW